MKLHRLNNFFAILLLIGFPFLSYLNINKAEAAFVTFVFIQDSTFLYISILLIIFMFSALSSNFFSFSFQRVSIAISVSFLYLFMFEKIHEPLIAVLGMYESEWIIGYSLGFLGILAFIFFLSKYQTFLSLIKLFSLVVIAIPLSQIILFFAFSEDSKATIKPVPKQTQTTYSPRQLEALDRPNIYYIVADSYGGEEALKRFADLDIGEFLDDVRNYNMYVAEQARSPYNLTFLSIAGILNADYVVDELSPAYTSRKPFYPGIMKSNIKPIAIEHFQKLGYEFNLLGNRWAKCYDKYVICPEIPDGSLLSYEIRGLLGATPFIWYEKKFGISLFEATPAVTVDAIGNLLNYVRRKGSPKTPSVFFVHHLSPHPPYMFKANCKLRDSFKFDFKAWNDKSKPLFAANTECTNKRILSLLNWLDANDPNAIIIITGDHGSAFTGINNVDERSSVLTLARFPDRCKEGLSPTINSINLMRMAMACAENKPPALLENIVYQGSYKKKGSAAGKVKLVQP